MGVNRKTEVPERSFGTPGVYRLRLSGIWSRQVWYC